VSSLGSQPSAAAELALVKPFDVGLEWMARYSALSKMQFWQEEDATK
jgi:hypothetical protein